MREKFEKLPEIAAHIHNVIFDIGCDEYLPKKMGYVIHEFSAYYYCLCNTSYILLTWFNLQTKRRLCIDV